MTMDTEQARGGGPFADPTRPPAAPSPARGAFVGAPEPTGRLGGESDAGLMGVPGITVYCGTKGGVINRSRAMALEIGPDVRVNGELTAARQLAVRPSPLLA
jgi:NAD(P)-dependent dehydrogenase (short-subunit alcohol dehydrogenase family)